MKVEIKKGASNEFLTDCKMRQNGNITKTQLDYADTISKYEGKKLSVLYFYGNKTNRLKCRYTVRYPKSERKDNVWGMDIEGRYVNIVDHFGEEEIFEAHEKYFRGDISKIEYNLILENFLED